MSLYYIDFIDRCDLPAGSCDSVSLCLNSLWAERTESGIAIIDARITRVNKYVPTDTVPNSCCTGSDLCAEDCKYQLEIDDDQFVTNDLTGLPWRPTSDDITEINPYPCHIAKILAFVQLQSDSYLDTAGMTSTPEITGVLNRQKLTFPIKRESDGTIIASGDLYVPGGSLSAPSPGTIRYTSGPGRTSDVAVCNVIESCFDGVTIVRNPGNANKYEVSIPALSPEFTVVANAPSGAARVQYEDGTIINLGPTVLVNNDLTSSPGINTFVASSLGIVTATWTLQRVPQHGSKSEVGTFPDAPFANTTAVNTLKNGSSLVRTPGYVEFVVTNPSLYRPMPILIAASASFSAQNTVGSGLIFWGHSLWINNAAVSGKNGRALAGYNIARTIHTGQVEDFVLPTIYHAHTIPAGGNVTIGVDFGDNEFFPSVGTTTFLQIESRQIAIIGGTI